MTSEFEGQEPGAGQAHVAEDKCKVEVWTTAKGAPQWRVRVVEGADQHVVDELVIRGVAAYRAIEVQLQQGGTEATRENWPPPGGRA